MAELANGHANFTWHRVLSDQAECAAGLVKGVVREVAHEGLLCDHADIHVCEFCICGPPAMLCATRQLLARLGVDEGRVASDDFNS